MANSIVDVIPDPGAVIIKFIPVHTDSVPAREVSKALLNIVFASSRVTIEEKFNTAKFKGTDSIFI